MTTARSEGETVPQLIADIRASGASQGHIARIVGVSVAAVSRWEAGERQPSNAATRRLRAMHLELTAWDQPGWRVSA